MSTTISARINDEIFTKLEKLSKATNRSKSYLAAEAIQKYIDDQLWQIEAINTAINDARAGNFANDKEIAKFKKKWKISEN